MPSAYLDLGAGCACIGKSCCFMFDALVGLPHIQIKFSIFTIYASNSTSKAKC